MKLVTVIDFKLNTGYTNMERRDMTGFKFLDIDRQTMEVLSECPLEMDMVS